MSRIVKPNFANPSSRTKQLIQRMARFDLHDRLELIGNEFGKTGFRTSFSLSDQVLTHAMLTSRANVDLVVDLDAKKDAHVLESLKNITQETYALEFMKSMSGDVEAVLVSDHLDKYIAKDKVHNLLTINPLADWNSKQLVEYILAHEVPVDAADILTIQSNGTIQAA